jgi:predicted site-specific integrase-resolvase
MVEIRGLREEDHPVDGKGVQDEGGVAVYCRVSSHEQKAKGDLARQVVAATKHCFERGLGKPLVFTDVGSGLSAKRAGLARLCKAVERGRVGTVVLTFKDRLTRFGFEYLRRYFASHGTRIIASRQPVTRTVQEELVDDLIAIVTSFSGRVHGMRGHGGRRTRRVDAAFHDAVKRECRRAWCRAVVLAKP